MYRGQDIGSNHLVVEKIVSAIREGHLDRLRTLLPHISVLRSPHFKAPLLRLFQVGDLRQKELAAIALGALGDSEAITPLVQSLTALRNMTGLDSEAVQAAVILALGEIGNGDAVEALSGIYESASGNGLSDFRRRLALCALGLLAQQGSQRAESELTRLLGDSDESVQIGAVEELATAYWHRPNDIPDSVIRKMRRMVEEGRGTIQEVGLDCLRSLADAGCLTAEEYFSSHSEFRRYA